MKIGLAIASAVKFLLHPPEPSQRAIDVAVSSNRVIEASRDLAHQQDILGNLVRQAKGARDQRKRKTRRKQS